MANKKKFLLILTLILALALFFPSVYADENSSIIPNETTSPENSSLDNVTVIHKLPPMDDSTNLTLNKTLNETLNESVNVIYNETITNITLPETIVNDSLPTAEVFIKNETLISNITKMQNMTIMQKIVEFFRIFADSLNFFMSSRPMIGLTGVRASGSSFSALIHSETFYGSTKGAVGGIYSANIGFSGNAIKDFGLSINSYEIYPKNAYNGSIIRLKAEAANYQSFWLVIRNPSGQNQTITLTSPSTNYYIANSTGRYYTEFRVNNSIGKYTTVYDYFDISVPSTSTNTTPPTNNGGSSGGGRGSSSSCLSVWECEPWSYCEYGMQQRTCEDKSKCNSNSRPEEKRNCTDSLFDVSLNFDSFTLSENNELEFYVKLLETKSGAKTDVTLEYVVSDENGRIIYESSDTKAVEGFLSFKKIIPDLAFEPGFYNLDVKIIYGNLKTASAYQKFEITPENKVKIEVPVNATGEISQEKPAPQAFAISPALVKSLIYAVYLLAFAILSLAIIFGLRYFGKSFIRPKRKNWLSSQMNKKVYSEHGKFIGKIKDVILENHRIYGWVVVVDKSIFDLAKPALIKTEHVKSIDDVMMVDSKIFHHLLGGKEEIEDEVVKKVSEEDSKSAHSKDKEDSEYLDFSNNKL